MLLALHDYIQYRNRSGRFTRKIKQGSLMGGAFEKNVPEDIIIQLKPGDILFIETFDSLISWAIMYLTNSQVSHIAIYLGDRNITHATDSGIVIESIDSLFDSNTRILPCIWHILEGKRDEVKPAVRKYVERVGFSLADNFCI
jgi:hypothetical protein